MYGIYFIFYNRIMVVTSINKGIKLYRFKLYEYLQKTYDIGICLEFFKIFNSESIILHTQTVPQELLFDKMEILLNYSKQIG